MRLKREMRGGRTRSQEARRLSEEAVRQRACPRGAAAAEGRFGGGLYRRGIHWRAFRRRRALLQFSDGDPGERLGLVAVCDRTPGWMKRRSRIARGFSA